jgi:hypothetical protein
MSFESLMATSPRLSNSFTSDFSQERNTGRFPVDLRAKNSRRFPAEIRRVLKPSPGNPLSSVRNQGDTSDYAFSPTCNSATLKGTPHPPIPQYPSGFFARYCW